MGKVNFQGGKANFCKQKFTFLMESKLLKKKLDLETITFICEFTVNFELTLYSFRSINAKHLHPIWPNSLFSYKPDLIYYSEIN